MKVFSILVFLVFSAKAFCSEVWCEEETVALCEAKEQNLPIVAVFLGDQWCPWSEKLNQEVLQRVDFAETLLPKSVLWRISLHQESKPQEVILRKKYKITECPTLLILDPNGIEFARISSLHVDVNEIAQLIDNFQEICATLEEEHFDEEKWQHIYELSKTLSVPAFRKLILEVGIQKEKSTFFHLERFSELLQKNKLNARAVVDLKKKILELDPSSHFKVASLEFEKVRNKKKPKKALLPLLHYLKENEDWRAEWLVAQYLFGKGAIKQAREYAQKALAQAPEEMKQLIGMHESMETNPERK